MSDDIIGISQLLVHVPGLSLKVYAYAKGAYTCILIFHHFGRSPLLTAITPKQLDV